MDRSVKGQELKKKIVFSLDSPNSTVEWPNINSADQDEILDLLCSLLVPIGQYRALYTQPSKGKHSRKRKRASLSTTPVPALPSPPPPELISFLTVGLNSTTRYLESMAAQVLPSGTTPPKPRLLAVFVCRSDSQPSQLHSHLPILCHIASRSSSEHTVRLVQLPKTAESRLANSLGIPQAGFLGLIEGAPGSSLLLNLVNEKVSLVKVSWLEGSAEYQPTAIKAMKAKVSPPSKRALKGGLVKTIVRVEV